MMRIPATNIRTIVSAMYPQRFEDDYCAIFLKVWFEELDEPVPFVATPFDVERHGKVLWIRAMAGEYGPIEVIPARVEIAQPTSLLLPAPA